VVDAQGVEELCRVLKEKAPASRAAMLATLSQAEQAIWKADAPAALNLLAGLGDSHIPLEIRARASECTADCFFLQGKFREADNKYREAAEGYVYEHELPGFGFIGLKKHPLSEDAPAEAFEVDSSCLKGYLLLARGLRYKGIACLKEALARLNRSPADTEISRLRTADVHLLLAGAYWAQGNRHLGALHGEVALRHLLEKVGPQPRADLLAFAELICRSVFEEAPATPRSTAAGESDQTLENVGVAVEREGKFDEARKVYQDVLQNLTKRDVKAALAVCNGVIQCVIKEERPLEGLGTSLFHFEAWAARSLPDEYEGCASLAVAKAYYLNNDLARALDEVRAHLEFGTDEDLMIQAQLLAGLIHFRAGRPTEAVRSFEEVLAGNSPQETVSAQALFLIGEINLVNGNTEKALEDFGVLLKKYPHTEYASESAQVLAGLGTGNSEAGDSALHRAARAPARN
jgi:tetratricopeptide (TPR) repeat protein